jgi:general secretion pathway protein G
MESFELTRDASTGTLNAKISGFTLIEVMVVIVILGILAALVVPRVMGAPDRARVSKAEQDVNALASALQLYRLDNFNYPSTDQGLQALVERPTGDPPAAHWQAGGYIDQLARDPWDRPYQYLSPGQHGEFDVYTLGRDGRPGGEGLDADIGNWDPGPQ